MTVHGQKDPKGIEKHLETGRRKSETIIHVAPESLGKAPHNDQKETCRSRSQILGGAEKKKPR